MELLAGLIIAITAATFILLPLWRRTAAYEYDWDGTAGESRITTRRIALEAEVVRYRESLRAGTVCARCAQANPPGSRFCMDCGRPLAVTPKTDPAPEPVAR